MGEGGLEGDGQAGKGMEQAVPGDLAPQFPDVSPQFADDLGGLVGEAREPGRPESR